MPYRFNPLASLLTLLTTLLLPITPAPAQGDDTVNQPNVTVIRVPAGGDAAKRPLMVGIKPAPPFAIKGSDGQWRGISVELWQHIAGELDLDYRWREADLEGLIAGVADTTLDLGVGALTITPAREERLDFSHAFYSTGLGIAVEQGQGGAWLTVVRRFASWQFLSVVGLLALVLLVSGLLVWLFERRGNPDEFGRSTVRGIGDGFWWSAVTMTTVGYGDKTPVTPGGRIVALVWMFASVIIISSFTASITSALTVGEMATTIRGKDDLGGARVGTVPESSAADWLRSQGFGFRNYPDVPAALQALEDGELEAVVYDAPILRYYIKENHPDRLDTLEQTFTRQDYALALTAGSERREEINRVLLERIGSAAWEETLNRYLGRRD